MIAMLLSTVLGIGFVRPAPGTVASAAALPLAWAIAHFLGSPALIYAALVVFLVGVIATDAYERRIGKPDPSECVIDEVAGQFLACAFAPLTILGYGIAFVLFRVFDITKLWPVSLGEKLPGGWGIMTDDVIAGALAAAIIAGLRWESLI